MSNPSVLLEETTILESKSSGVAWPAIFGGAFIATGITAILAPIGAALGFAWASPWHAASETGTGIAISSGIWLIIVQWLAAGMGGYFTGRLRTGWAGAHTHEVYFRDTVHGFLSWTLATVTGILLFVAAGTHMASHAAMSSHTSSASMQDTYIDELYGNTRGTTISQGDREESGRLMANAIANSKSAEQDKALLTYMVEMRTNMSEGDAMARVNDTLNREKAAMDTARKAAAGASLLIALTLLIGAFIASVAGALGGAHRDNHYATGRLGD